MAPNEQNPIVDAVQDLARAAGKWFERIKSELEPAAKAFGWFGKRLFELQRHSELIDKAGFVPHQTMPENLIEQSSGDPTRLSELLEHYYEENWPKVRDEIMARVKDYQIDNEAKEAFQEALIAHETRLYRSVVRNLLCEIERVARKELYERPVWQPDIKKFAEWLQELPIGVTIHLDPSGCFGLMQLSRLKGHLYISVDQNDAKQIAQLEADAVPNRHAAIHGLAVYCTAKNSLDTIFITDFFCQAVTLAKEYVASRKARD